MSENVRVIVRCRPPLVGETNTVSISEDEVTLNGENRFTFDGVFGSNSSQIEIFENSVESIVEQFLNGFNGTVFAYGQTGSGKTHTMFGTQSDPGIALRVFERIFVEKISNFRVSFLEIYNEEIRDLIGPARKGSAMKLQPSADGTIKGLSEKSVSCVEEIISVLSLGLKNRVVSATLMNSVSSRSHSVFTIFNNSTKIHLVDLAGSERQSKSGASGDTLKEAAKINLSLSALGNVISALSKGNSSVFIPYRDSKLTMLLQEALGGFNTRTVMIATISPSFENLNESISTLRYAHRAKSIQNRPKKKSQLDSADVQYIESSWMETVRELDKLNRFYESVIHTMIPADVMRRLEATSFYNEVLGIWEVNELNTDSVYEPDSIDEDEEEEEEEIVGPSYPKARGLVTLKYV